MGRLVTRLHDAPGQRLAPNCAATSHIGCGIYIHIYFPRLPRVRVCMLPQILDQFNFKIDSNKWNTRTIHFVQTNTCSLTYTLFKNKVQVDMGRPSSVEASDDDTQHIISSSSDFVWTMLFCRRNRRRRRLGLREVRHEQRDCWDWTALRVWVLCGWSIEKPLCRDSLPTCDRLTGGTKGILLVLMKCK